jgi:aminopeptidase-like protein
LSRPDIRYSYRIIFIPETIGSIAYLSQNLIHLKKYVFAGFNISCVGDNRAFSYLPSRHGNTVSDKIARHVLKWLDPNFKSYTWRDRGSDERQYCAPHIDLPISSIMRTKYGEYPEYHTSLDNLTDVVTPDGLQGGYDALTLSIEALERNLYPTITTLGEPQLGTRGIYPTLSTKEKSKEIRVIMDLLTWSDGANSLLDIAEKCNVPIWELYKNVELLERLELLNLSSKAEN